MGEKSKPITRDDAKMMAQWLLENPAADVAGIIGRLKQLTTLHARDRMRIAAANTKLVRIEVERLVKERRRLLH